MQYKEGLVSITNGTKIVNGTGTKWVTNGIAVGDWFKIKNSPLIYQVESVDSEVQITLVETFGQPTVTNGQYLIHKDFSEQGYPFIYQGDLDWPDIYNRFVNQLGQEEFNYFIIISPLGKHFKVTVDEEGNLKSELLI